MSEFTGEMHQVHDILDRYIAIHDKIFKFSLRTIIPIPGLFKRIDFGEQFIGLDSLVSEMEKLEISEKNSGEVPSIIHQYASALLKTITFLRDMCSRLYNTSQGDPRGYKMGQYNADVATYKGLVKEYRSLGSTLNDYVGK